MILIHFFFPAEDEAAAARITAKNGLESYTYTTFVNSLTNKKPADKFDAADKSRLETAVNETIKWFATSQDGLEEDYKEKLKEFRRHCKVSVLFSLFFSWALSLRRSGWCSRWC